MNKNKLKTLALIITPFFALWSGILLCIRFFETPYFWIILLLAIFSCSFFAIRKNKKIGIVLTIITLIIIVILLIGLKQLYCFNYGVVDEEVNEMIDITFLSEDEKSFYTWTMNNYQPGQKLVISKGFKATNDCEAIYTPLTMLKEIFTENW